MVGNLGQVTKIAAVAVAALMVAASPLMADSESPISAAFEKPVVNDDGSVMVPSFKLPFSSLASPEAKAAFIQGQKESAAISDPTLDVAALRKIADEVFAFPRIKKMHALYDVDMTEQTIGGVFTQVFVPKAGIAAEKKNRVLINLHGGGFIMGARTISQTESIPIAALGRIKVVSVDYRQGPEYRFPAASEDVSAVYKELLKEHKPSEIGIYGCSAGGMLTGEAMAWFDKEGLPMPAAIGIFCASTNHFGLGDSAQLSPQIGGGLRMNREDGGPVLLLPYFEGVDADDPHVVPSASPALLAKFPPTLFITGSRALEMSATLHSHIQLVKAGVDARLFVWDGMDHGFHTNPDLPESRESYDIIVRFFDEHMDKAARAATP